MSEAIERFEVNNDQKAEWALDKIREARADRDRWIAFYKEQIEKVKAECDDNTANLEFMLRTYFAERSKEGFTKATKTQESYQLPGGKLILKKQAPEFEHDDSVLVPWLEQNAPGFVKIEKSAAWGELKKVVEVSGDSVIDENGEVVPGVTVTARTDKFVVQIKEG